MTKAAFDRLAAGLADALAFACGDADTATLRTALADRAPRAEAEAPPRRCGQPRAHGRRTDD